MEVLIANSVEYFWQNTFRLLACRFSSAFASIGITLPECCTRKSISAVDLSADQALVPDKVIALLNALARESLGIANQALSFAKKSGVSEENKKELARFVTDSKLYILSTEVMIHKEQAAILKARMLINPNSGLEEQFMYHFDGLALERCRFEGI